MPCFFVSIYYFLSYFCPVKIEMDLKSLVNTGVKAGKGQLVTAAALVIGAIVIAIVTYAVTNK